MANTPFSGLTELAEPPAIDDLMAWTDKSDTTGSTNGTSKRNKAQYALGSQVNAQTGTSYTYLTTDFRKLVTHSNGSAIAGTLPQAGASFPAGWIMFVQNRGAGALTITPTTSTIDGAATLVLNQNEGAIVVSDGTNYFTFRGKQATTGGAPSGSAGGDLTGTYPNPTIADDVVDAAALAPADVNAQTGTTYTLQASDNNKVVTLSNASAITVTVPSGLGAGFSCLCVQIGAGQVTFSPSSTTINNRQSHTKIAGQYGVASLVAYASNVFALGGDTAS